jgi:hypothetical protein
MPLTLERSAGTFALASTDAKRTEALAAPVPSGQQGDAQLGSIEGAARPRQRLLKVVCSVTPRP